MSKEKKPTKPSLNKNTLKTAKRLLGYVTKTYKVQFIIVLICILVSSIATISVSLSLKFLLDDYIIPLIGQKSPDYTELYQALGILACIFLSGVIASFIYTRLMVVIGQGVLKRVRDEMFEHMQKLPIRYFDRIDHEPLYKRYGYASSDDQSVDPAGAYVGSYDRSHIYCDACFKSDPDSSRRCDDQGDDGCCENGRRKQRKILCTAAA